VVHFTKTTSTHTDYANMMSIYSRRVLEAVNPFGIAKNYCPNILSQHAVCFSEIPLHLLKRISCRRGSYGIGFRKELILERGGGPIWYIEKGKPSWIAVNDFIQQALKSVSPEKNPIWTITPMVDAPGEYSTGSYRFEWEREWRHVGDFHFKVDEVAFLIIPENLHSAARGFFEDVSRENLGPAYFCPFIDPIWNIKRIEGTLESLRKSRNTL